jgi:hypothetical protein
MGKTAGGLIPVDDLTEAVEVISYPHHEIHEGNAYCACHGVDLGAATRDYLIVAPTGPEQAHLTLAVLASLDLDMTLFEGTDRVGGTAVSAGNRNRNSGNSASTVITHTPGAGVDGTQMLSALIGDPAGPGSIAGGGASSDGRHEFILKSGESYLLRITSTSADCRVTVFLDWYEHTPKG